MTKAPTTPEAGFSLLEAIIALTILVIIGTTLSRTSITSSLAAKRSDEASIMIIQADSAAALAMAGGGEKFLSDLEGVKYTLHIIEDMEEKDPASLSARLTVTRDKAGMDVHLELPTGGGS